MQKQNIGNAGEYYIASRLSAENFIATITLGRAEKYDILAVSSTGRNIKFSVKAGYKISVTEFPLSEKDENGYSKDFYYAFIRLNEFRSDPDFWIIPSRRVCQVIQKSEEEYLRQPGKKGQQRQSTTLRILPIILKGYQKSLYPKNWEKEMEKYYKNISQLK